MRILIVPVLALSAATMAFQPTSKTSDPLAFFSPFIRFSEDERRSLDRREAIVRMLPADGHSVTGLAAGMLTVGPDRLIAKVKDIAALRRGDIVPAVARFSDRPMLGDLSTLLLDEGDLNAVADCRPGDCDLKLGTDEIARLKAVRDEAGSRWRPAVQEEFRRIVLERARSYLEGGLGALADYADHDEPVSPAAMFSGLLEETRWLQRSAPEVVAYLEQSPDSPSGDVDSFLYWLKETYAPKPIISVWHTSIFRRNSAADPLEVLIVTRLVFATHYLEGGLATTALLKDGDRRYLVYVNHSSIDVLGGMLGGLKRFFLERRIKGEAEKIFEDQRRRIES